MSNHVADIPDGRAEFPPVDETGDVDLSLLELCLSLSPVERAARHFGARMLAERMRRIARERYGSLIDDIEAAE
jgi:hypothetical protein